mgnify:CR=1 FL=1
MDSIEDMIAGVRAVDALIVIDEIFVVPQAPWCHLAKLPFPAISCGSCYFLRCPPISGEFVLFTAVFLGLKCVLKIVSKSIQNQPKINPKSTPNWSKITQKSTPNRSKMAPWRGSRFLLIFDGLGHPNIDVFLIDV